MYISELSTTKGDFSGLYGGYYTYSQSGEVLQAALYSSQITSPGHLIGLVSDPQLEGLIDRAKQKAYAKGKSGDLPGLTHLGELKETVHMLKSPLSSLRKLFELIFLSSRSKGLGRNYFTRLSDAWLEYRYGVLPLVLSISEIIDKYNNGLMTEQALNVIRAGETTQDISVTYPVRAAYTLSNVSIDTKQTIKAGVSAHCSLVAAQKIDLATALGFSWHDIPATVWELTTLSFVWDWFVNVGTWLNAITPKEGFEVKSGTVSVKYFYEVEVAVQRYYTPYDSQASKDSVTYKEQHLVRSLDTTMPVMPLVNDEFLNLIRAIDSISLLWGRIRSIMKPH
jgi:hypothetical protein